ncbi:3-hydroxyacyl-CoA dehydrogenase family protein [Baekduia soli]|uniref:3-hydroxyacyl-CoA dehydrogenase family protein n=2 Tax=Baekduia soli TaxID=496014 RepID=A0A5B8UC96_9ACTN|nr:3-hydroxyacyl-CoA dehydrogenase family protein [Baekduia soli]
MGAGFVQVLALAGVSVRIADASPEHAEAGRGRAIALAQAFERDRLMAAGSADAIAERTVAVASPREAAADAEFVLEAVAEDPEVKRGVLAELEAGAAEACILATNTSAIPIRVLAEGLRRPERFLGVHWFNPPQWVPGVEVIPGERTRPEVVSRVREILVALGKEPATVGDSAGFVGNRIQFAMFKEAASVVADGVATAEEVDRVVRSTFGFRLPFFGPFMIADMAGLDVYAGAYAALEKDLGPRFAVPESVRALVDAGRLGTKSGGGYLDLDPAEVARIVAERDALYVALSRLVAERDAAADA